ncbi:K+-transporting ATPase, B subunit, partial [mine drainage metagenome]
MSETDGKPRLTLNASFFVQATMASFRKLDPRVQIRNPVMFVVFIGACLTTMLYFRSLVTVGETGSSSGFILATTIWLWLTVLFANFAEAVGEGQNRAQVASLRKARRDTPAKKLAEARYGASFEIVSSQDLNRGDLILVEAGDWIAGDGEVVEGLASVDESAITGESAPVIRGVGGDFDSVTGGTRILSDWLIVKISADPGQAFL